LAFRQSLKGQKGRSKAYTNASISQAFFFRPIGTHRLRKLNFFDELVSSALPLLGYFSEFGKNNKLFSQA
jgi:hypothetical protein